MSHEVGDVFLIPNNAIYPPNKKFSICVCAANNLFFLINSENREKYDCIAITRSDNSFLQHDSFVSCSRVFNYHIFVIKKSKFIGAISNADLTRIVDKVASSEVLSENKIGLITKNLNTRLNRKL